jgi:hypothetical protein
MKTKNPTNRRTIISRLAGVPKLVLAGWQC